MHTDTPKFDACKPLSILALTEVESFDSCRLTMPSSSPTVTPLCVQVIIGGGLPFARHSSVTLECSSIVASAGDLMMTGGTEDMYRGGVW